MREPFTIERAGGGGKALVRSVGMLVLIGILAIVAFSSTSRFRTGHVGVVSVFGRVTGQTLHEGIHLVNPAALLTELSVKTQEGQEQASGPSKAGLIMGLEASILYHLDSARAAEIYQQIGPNYAEVLPPATFRRAMRAAHVG